MARYPVSYGVSPTGRFSMIRVIKNNWQVFWGVKIAFDSVIMLMRLLGQLFIFYFFYENISHTHTDKT